MAEVDPLGSKPMFSPLPFPQDPSPLSAGEGQVWAPKPVPFSLLYLLPPFFPRLLDSPLGTWSVVLAMGSAQKGQFLLPLPYTLPSPLSGLNKKD